METPGIYFYAAETKDNSIIAYGDTHQKKRKFKIAYNRKTEKYHVYKKVSGKYWQLCMAENLDDAKESCVLPKK